MQPSVGRASRPCESNHAHDSHLVATESRCRSHAASELTALRASITPVFASRYVEVCQLVPACRFVLISCVHPFLANEAEVGHNFNLDLTKLDLCKTHDQSRASLLVDEHPRSFTSSSFHLGDSPTVTERPANFPVPQPLKRAGILYAFNQGQRLEHTVRCAELPNGCGHCHSPTGFREGAPTCPKCSGNCS